MDNKKKKKVKKKASERSVITDGDYSTANNGQNGNRVFVSVGKNINIGNYESVRVEYGEGRTVQDGQSFDDVRDNCLRTVLGGIQEMIPIVEEALKQT